MRILPDSARVRVFEPDPAAPSGALPIFGESLDKLGKRITRGITTSVVMILLGAMVFFTSAGPALPVTTTGLFVCLLVFWIYCWVTGVPPARLKRTPFRLLDLGEGDLVIAGKTVGIRLPDDRWLHIWLPRAWRLQLAGQRRIWLLGDGDRVFTVLPGSLSVQRGRVLDAPPRGAVPLPPVSREPTSPRDDVVLGAHRRFLSRTQLVVSAVFEFFGVLMLALQLAFPDSDTVIILALVVMLILGGLVVAKFGVDFGKPLAADNWTELRLVPDGPMRINAQGLARLSGWTMLADGREIGVRIVKVDPSMAANIAVTGQLWVAGMPQPGRTAVIGVPGYPVTGKARLAQ